MQPVEWAKAATIYSYNDNLIRAILGIGMEERAVRVPAPDEVVIRVSASPVNPSDIAFLRGGYNVFKPLPAVPGFEGAGIVVDTGNNVRHWRGKMVSFFTRDDNDGAWSEYVVTSKTNCFLIKENVPANQAACFSVNPFTAYGLFQMAVESGAGIIVQNAAGGQVAGFIRYFAKESGLEVINIVRKKEQKDDLNRAGHITINSVDDDYLQKLSEITAGRKVFVIDAVGGEATGRLINTMPPGSTLALYGGLSGGNIGGIDPIEVIFRDKRFIGFNLNLWRTSVPVDRLEQVSEQLQKIIAGGKCTTRIQGTYPLSEIVPAIRAYIRNMSAGKALLIPGEKEG
ncbi:MAG: zinc-binding dehydrogenase [Bacteroidales bacterium]|nr:zinc-binding dehydrogenase [Bacteroidales bacterium]